MITKGGGVQVTSPRSQRQQPAGPAFEPGQLGFREYALSQSATPPQRYNDKTVGTKILSPPPSMTPHKANSRMN